MEMDGQKGNELQERDRSLFSPLHYYMLAITYYSFAINLSP